MRYDCRYGLPHDVEIIGENGSVKVERCKVCKAVWRWQKRNGRIDNLGYLKVHARNFAQRGGRTNQLYMKLYHPEETKLTLTRK